MSRLQRVLRPCLLSFLVSLIAPLAQAGGVVPSELTVGADVSVNGVGFDGGTPPRVVATRAGSSKKMVLQVLDYTDTDLVARVKKVPSSKKDPAGGKSWTLSVQPRGPEAGAPVVFEAAFTTPAPTVLGVQRDSAAPGEDVTLQVRHAGSGKLAARVNGRKAKVVSVVPSTVEGAAVLSDVVVRVPNTHDGFFDVFVGNSLGTNPSDGLLEITGSTRPFDKDGLEGTLDGATLRAKGSALGVLYTNGVLNLDLQTGKNPARQLVVAAPFNIAIDQVPAAYSGLPEDSALISYGEIDPGQPVQGWSGLEGGIEVRVNARDGNRLVVAFEGALVSQGVEGDGRLRHLSGRATVTLPTAAVLMAQVSLTGEQEVPPVITRATAAGLVSFDTTTRELVWQISVDGLEPTAAHFHGPAVVGQNAGVALGLNAATNPIAGAAIISASDAADLLDGLWYVNVHTVENQGGEIRAQVVLN